MSFAAAGKLTLQACQVRQADFKMLFVRLCDLDKNQKYMHTYVHIAIHKEKL